jgi:hypothetical protein
MSLFLRMSIPRYTQLLASLINPTNNIFYKIQWVCYKNFVGWVKKSCQLLGIPRYTHAEKQSLCGTRYRWISGQQVAQRHLRGPTIYTHQLSHMYPVYKISFFFFLILSLFFSIFFFSLLLNKFY